MGVLTSIKEPPFFVRQFLVEGLAKTRIQPKADAALCSCASSPFLQELEYCPVDRYSQCEFLVYTFEHARLDANGFVHFDHGSHLLFLPRP